PFLLLPDRQAKVRWFMDVYTDTLAQYPSAEFDFIGHSNGTYILASALQRYRTLRVHDVYFAGSVVPQQYPWGDLIRSNRVHRVRNVVATSDWVVAIFPRFYEQIAEWFGLSTISGYFDVGAAGFRGFRSEGIANDGVVDLTFAQGSHGTGVDLTNATKRHALIACAEHGIDSEQDRVLAEAFRDATAPNSMLDVASNVSWLVWLVLVTLLAAIGVIAWRFHPYLGFTYAILLLGLL